MSGIREEERRQTHNAESFRAQAERRISGGVLAISDSKLGWVPAEKGPREFAGLGW